MLQERWSPAVAAAGGLAGGGIAGALAYWIVLPLIADRFGSAESILERIFDFLGILLIFGFILFAVVVAGFLIGPLVALRIVGANRIASTLTRILLLEAVAVPAATASLLARVDSPTADLELLAAIALTGAVVPALARWWTVRSGEAKIYP